ncbi:hypothetical protein MPSEU_000144300 [Mayamaea pseudoterrestris]|nr:hypothetical protein MPSEU_000144300 [Mayamaea pseudoterrestris]
MRFSIAVLALQLLPASQAFTNSLRHARTSTAKNKLHSTEDDDDYFDPYLDKALRTDVFQLYSPPGGGARTNGIVAPSAAKKERLHQKSPPAVVFYDSKRRKFMQGFKSSVQTVRDISKKTISTVSKASIQAPEVVTSQLESIVTNARTLAPFQKVQRLQIPQLSHQQNEYFGATAAGFCTSLTLAPEAVAFAVMTGVNPLVALWTSVIVGMTASLLGGRPGLISGTSGACAMVCAGLCAQKGPQYLTACALLAGVFQIAGGVLGVGKFIRLVPQPVMLGFVNGLALLMAKTQLIHFAGLSPLSAPGVSAIGISAATIGLVKLLPKFSKVIPPSLGAVTLVSIVSAIFKLPVKRLADVAGAGTFAGGWQALPKIGLPSVPLNLATVQTVLPYAIIIAVVGLLESLLTTQVVDGMLDDGKRGSTEKECIAQGAANVASGLFGGMAGGVQLGQSILNVQSGGAINKWSGISAGIFLAGSIVLGAPLVGAIPVASLAGVMLLVCQSTFSWSSLRVVNKIPKIDACILAMTSILTLQKNLAAAVLYGTMASALGFAWRKSKMLRADEYVFEDNNVKLYSLKGPLFFGSAGAFDSIFDVGGDPEKVIMDFSECRVHDHSALDAVCSMAEKYSRSGKQVIVRRVSSDTAQLLRKLDRSGSLIVETDATNDPQYQVAENSELYENLRIG